MSRVPLLLLLAGCAGSGAAELHGPLLSVGLLPPEGEILPPEDTLAFRRAVGDVLRARGYVVSDCEAPLRGDPWGWKADVRRAQGVDALLRTRVGAVERDAITAEVHLVEAAGGRTLYWNERRTKVEGGLYAACAERLLERVPGPSRGSGAPPPRVEPPRVPPPAPPALTPTWEVGEGVEIRLGGNSFIDCPVPIEYAGWPLVAFSRLPDGTLGVDVDLRDERGEPLARVRGNRLIGREARRYAVTRTEERWTLKEAETGAAVLDLARKDGRVEVALKLRAPDGTLWEATPEAMDLGPLKMRGNTYRSCRVGIALGKRR